MFRSFFLGGFECSTHRTRAGRRLDLVASTQHDRFARQDYARLRAAGILTAREGIRWHLVEPAAGRYDFATASPFVAAARESGVEVIWDLFHYGWPDRVDVWGPAFPEQLGDLAHAFASWLRAEGAEARFVTPVNEISFLSWAAGEVGAFYPYARRRGGELKAQLVRAAIRAIEATWAVSPGCRIVHAEPVINVVARPSRPAERVAAERYRLLQYEAMEMLAGRVRPELGGQPRYVDVVGLNYYHDNQWFFGSGRRVRPGQRHYRPLRALLLEWHERLGRPMLIAETGIEDKKRPDWLRFVCREVDAAIVEGAPIHGVCLYPIVNHPGWVNDRHCHNGLWDYAEESGDRPAYEPLAWELGRQVARHRPAVGHVQDEAEGPAA